MPFNILIEEQAPALYQRTLRISFTRLCHHEQIREPEPELHLHST